MVSTGKLEDESHVLADGMGAWKNNGVDTGLIDKFWSEASGEMLPTIFSGVHH